LLYNFSHTSSDNQKNATYRQILINEGRKYPKIISLSSHVSDINREKSKKSIFWWFKNTGCAAKLLKSAGANIKFFICMEPLLLLILLVVFLKLLWNVLPL
jgi:hypothetical protein